MEAIVSVQTCIDVSGDLSIIGLSRGLDEANLIKVILKAFLERIQEDLVNQLCGERYTRNRDSRYKYKRAGTARRTLVTRHGTISFRLVKVRSLEDGSMMRPLLLYLGVEPRRRIVDDLVLESAEAASMLTYRDTKNVIELFTNAETSKHRVHRYVQQVGAYMDRKRRKTATRKVNLMYGDSTKAHGIHGKKNTVNVVLGKDLETAEKHLLALDVNRGWVETAWQVRAEADVLISDADKEMRNALIDKALCYQLCVNHAVRGVNNHLWRAKMPREERKQIRDRLKAILCTLRNSVRKHLKDMDTTRLNWRIKWVLEELKNLAHELREEGFIGAAKFIRNSANYMVTYAKLAIQQVKVPYTNNLIERLMGEVAKRVKNRWMHWSTKGLENMLNILLIRYCNKHHYTTLKSKYYKHETPLIRIKIT